MVIIFGGYFRSEVSSEVSRSANGPGFETDAKGVPQGLKPSIIASFMYGLKAVPFNEVSFPQPRCPQGLLALLILRDRLFQSSLRDFSMVHANPGLRPGLSSDVPTGLILQSVGSHAASKGQLLSRLKWPD